MLHVYVWPPYQNMVGHTSLSFDNNYVSFWPEEGADKKDLKIKRSHPGHFMESLQEDIREEGDRQPIVVTIKDYDKDQLSKFIADLISNKPRYQLAKNNCSHIVAECLKVASNQDPSFHPTPRNYGKIAKLFGRGIWTPNEILRYARELANNRAAHA